MYLIAASEQEEHEEFERQERAKIDANMANLLVEMEAQRYSYGSHSHLRVRFEGCFSNSRE